MSNEQAWTPVNNFAMGTVKVGGDAKPVEESKEEDYKDDDKSKSDG